MNLDVNVARHILLQLESNARRVQVGPIAVPGCTPEDVSAQVEILYRQGYIDAESVQGDNEPTSWRALRLTDSGHRYLEQIRNP